MHLNTFGFFKNGFMKVNVSNLSLKPPVDADDKSSSSVSYFASIAALSFLGNYPCSGMFLTCLKCLIITSSADCILPCCEQLGGIHGLQDLSSSAIYSALRTNFNLSDPPLNLCVCIYLFCV